MVISREEGFTLVELIIVIIVIAILVSIAVPVYASMTDNARMNACKANLRTIDGTISQYRASNQDWPTNIDQIKPYLKDDKCPNEPFGGNYTLGSDSNGTWCNCSLGHEY